MTQQEYLNSKLDFTSEGIFLNGRNIVRYDEKELMRRSVFEICQKVKPKVILEVGYGLGFSSDAFDEWGVNRHIIVEPHPTILATANRKDREFIEDFIQNVNLADELSLIYDDMTDFTGVIPDYTKFNYTWHANMPTGKFDCPGFPIDVVGVMWFQPLRLKEW